MAQRGSSRAEGKRMNTPGSHISASGTAQSSGAPPPESTTGPVAFGRFKGNEYWPSITFNRVTGDAFGWPYTHLVNWKFEARGVIELKFIDDRVVRVRIVGRNLRKGFDMIRRREVGDLFEQHVGEFNATEDEPYIDSITVHEEG